MSRQIPVAGSQGVCSAPAGLDPATTAARAKLTMNAHSLRITLTAALPLSG